METVTRQTGAAAQFPRLAPRMANQNDSRVSSRFVWYLPSHKLPPTSCPHSTYSSLAQNLLSAVQSNTIRVSQSKHSYPSLQRTRNCSRRPSKSCAVSFIKEKAAGDSRRNGSCHTFLLRTILMTSTYLSACQRGGTERLDSQPKNLHCNVATVCL